MNTERSVKILGVLTLALVMAACATHKAETDNPPPPAATTTAPAKPATPASSSSNESAEASAAAGANGLQANNLPGNDASASGKGNGKSGSNGADDSGATGLAAHTFYFDYDSSALQSADTANLQAHAAYLAKTPAARLRVEGHCDERGTREYNMALGERRAKAVAAFLTSNGASADQLSVISYGKEKPAVDGHDDAAWAKNRRVELSYTAGQP